MTRILLFTGVGWAFGTVHSELVRYLHAHGVVADILDWSKSYGRNEMHMMADYYDRIYSVPGETWPLTESYGIPHHKIIVVAHGEYDLQYMLTTRDPNEINRFAGYGVISNFLKQQSIEFGVSRIPQVVKYGINTRRFFSQLPMALRTVGYGGSMHRADPTGADWKRGGLGQQATEAAGPQFAPAGRYHCLAMPCL